MDLSIDTFALPGPAKQAKDDGLAESTGALLGTNSVSQTFSFSEIAEVLTVLPDRKRSRSSILMDTARRLWRSDYRPQEGNAKGAGIGGCKVWRQRGETIDPNLAQVRASYDSDNNLTRVGMHQHYSCGSPWGCPICTPAAVRNMSLYLVEYLDPEIRAKGYAVSMITLSLRHQMSLGAVTPVLQLKRAWKSFDARAKRIWERLGLVGKLRALDARFGKNGLHPHMHVVLVYEIPEEVQILGTERIKAMLSSIQNDLRELWVREADRVGGEAGVAGFNWIQNAQLRYLAKEWTTKETGGYTSSSMLDLINRASFGDHKAGRDYVASIKALVGCHRWNMGVLPKKLGLQSPSNWQPRPLPKPVREEITAFSQVDHMAASRGSRSSLAITFDRARKSSALVLVATVEKMADEVIAMDDLRQLTGFSNPWPEVAMVLTKASMGPLIEHRDKEIYLIVKHRIPRQILHQKLPHFRK